MSLNKYGPYLMLLLLIPAAGSVLSDEAPPPDKNEHGVVDIEPLGAVSDVRGEKGTFSFKNFVAVPIPLSNPTLGTGLVGVAAYFWPQTEEQKKAQPASLTGIGAMYTDSKSSAVALLQQNYWGGDKWRFTGVAGFADLNLDLNDPTTGDEDATEWLIKGNLALGSIARRISDSDWYLGAQMRYLDIEQTFKVKIGDNVSPALDFDLGSRVKVAGVGMNISHDTRDIPTNAYRGSLLEIKYLYNKQDSQSGYRGYYDTYTARWRSYHQLLDPLVLAYDINGCTRSGQVPLWDACRLALRGFSATKYLSEASVSTQAEGRWQFYPKWRLGMAAFAGVGYTKNTSSAAFDGDVVPSYGLGLRWMVMRSKRINVRVDYARSSDNSSAWYLSVLEAF